MYDSPVHVAPEPGQLFDAGSVAQLERVRREGRRHHYPALDGVRGIAFLAVFVGHYYRMLVPTTVLAWGGWLGVDLFFVLSGFLITGILFDSLEEPRYFRNFYIRRALRIFPLYYMPWIFFLIVTPWLHPRWSIFDLSRVLYFYNLMDLYSLRHPGQDLAAFLFHTPAGRLTGFNVGVLWSLSLEEQFYLVWPLLLFLVRNRRRLMWVCVALTAATAVSNLFLLRWALSLHIDRIFLYDATYAHVSPMLMGAWLALWMRGRPAGKPVQAPVYLGIIAVPACVLVYLIGTVIRTFNLEHPLIPTVGYLCSGLMSVGVILAAIQQEGLLKRVFSFKVLTSLGTISYGLYIFHGFLMSAASNHLSFFRRHGLTPLFPVAAFALTLIMALVSYHLYERPFLRLKERWAPSRPVSITGRDPLAQPARSS